MAFDASRDGIGDIADVTDGTSDGIRATTVARLLLSRLARLTM